jgi:NADH-quinone oxidoreductase chain I
MAQYFRDIFQSVWTILVGMKVTFVHMFVPAVTIQYPDVKLKLPERARNRLYVNIDDCIGCDQCSMACPVDCITIETSKALPTDDLGTTSTGQKKRLWVTKFDIDIAKCCYCGLCVPPCPTECIYMTDVYEFSEFDRNNLIYNYSALTAGEVAEIKRKSAEYEKEQAAKKAAAAQAAAAAKAAGAPAAGAVTKPAVTTPATPKPAATTPKPTTAQTAPKPAPAAQPGATPKPDSEQAAK